MCFLGCSNGLGKTISYFSIALVCTPMAIKIWFSKFGVEAGHNLVESLPRREEAVAAY